MLFIRPKTRLTITYGVYISKAVELAGGRSVLKGATPSSFVFVSQVIVKIKMLLLKTFNRAYYQFLAIHGVPLLYA